MQIMFESGAEHGVVTQGVGEWPGVVEELPADILPHMGWNTVDAPADSVIFEGISDERFYFVHSYAVQRWDFEAQELFRPPLVTWSEHGARFIAAVENGPLVATQFHPEKSGDAGLGLLANWLRSIR
jgi:glutamine amidotransferase